MKIVFNTSPLIFLEKLKYLDKIFDIFDEVIIPKAVYDEIRAKNDESSKKIAKLVDMRKIKVLQVEPEDLFKELTQVGFRIKKDLFFEIFKD
ncbi:hypothetical protein VFC49_08845 [Thermococcus sp. SY098]|uniref:hypothetical protein n=1 Tax=Thermococcus sp. SY098 TaxID=3111325 RepID=UPI002D76CC03|nr:hypothetical protein [Thermococcus sp. SY098]WRS52156.1 hypothetical protein VFC49_08845 [Thermococcus sp. SY098]